MSRKSKDMVLKNESLELAMGALIQAIHEDRVKSMAIDGNRDIIISRSGLVRFDGKTKITFEIKEK